MDGDGGIKLPWADETQYHLHATTCFCLVWGPSLNAKLAKILFGTRCANVSSSSALQELSVVSLQELRV
eukprot:4741783-Pleurochrysis_carterae.AAC.2